MLSSFCFLSVTVKAQDYGAYHDRVTAIEVQVVDRNFQDALASYQHLFEDYEFVFLRDYKVAAQLAALLGRKEVALQIIRDAMLSGWDIKHIRRNELLSALTNEPEWQILKSDYPELHHQYLTSIDLARREQVHDMFKDDQRKAFGVFIRIGEKAQERYATKKFLPQSNRQIHELIEIMNNSGYPGERLIGNNYWMSTILSHHNSITREQTLKDTLYPFIMPMLLEAVKTGFMSPYELVLTDDWYRTVYYNRSRPGYGFLDPPKAGTMATTNALRASAGLRSVELRNRLVDISEETDIEFYLPDWVDGKIEIDPD